jgi:OOP family OmpA-OmpF porin
VSCTARASRYAIAGARQLGAESTRDAGGLFGAPHAATAATARHHRDASRDRLAATRGNSRERAVAAPVRALQFEVAMKLSMLSLVSLVAIAGCSHHAKIELAVKVKAPEPVAEPVKEPEPPKPELPKPAPEPLVAATTTGAQLDVPGTIEFERDRAALHHTTRGTQDTLAGVLKILTDNPSITKLRIEGHTDSDGDDAANQALSESRAKTVRGWLVKHGVAEARLVAVGCAAKDPLVPNSSEDNKQKNRRTEFDIEEIDGKPPADYTTACAPNPKRK